MSLIIGMGAALGAGVGVTIHNLAVGVAIGVAGAAAFCVVRKFTKTRSDRDE